MERRPGYYLVRFMIVALLLAGGWTAFALLGPSWWQLATAVMTAPCGRQSSASPTFVMDHRKP